LDLDYPEDSEAGVDGNFIMTAGKLVEVQMSAEGATFSRGQMDNLLDLAGAGITALNRVQLDAVK
jgi:ribonuclease PH